MTTATDKENKKIRSITIEIELDERMVEESVKQRRKISPFACILIEEGLNRLQKKGKKKKKKKSKKLKK